MNAKMITSLGLAFGAMAMVLAACNSDEDNGNGSRDGGSSNTNPTDTAKFCGDLCARVTECDNARDEQTCKNSCVNQNVATLPKLRADVVSLIAECIQSRDCATVLSGAIFGACSGEAAASIAPSATATEFCNKLYDAERKCDRSMEKATCLNMAKLYSDAALTEAIACTEKGCSDIGPCVTAALGGVVEPGPNTDAGTDSGKKDAGNACELTFQGWPECTDCVKDMCAGPIAACQANATCNAFLCCFSECADAFCQTDCFNTYDPPPTLLDNIGLCQEDWCAAPCGL